MRLFTLSSSTVTLAASAATLIAMSACVKTKPVADPVRAAAPGAKKEAAAEAAPGAKLAPEATPATSLNTPESPAAKAEPAKPVMDDCDASVKFTDGEPIFLPENKVMLTRVMSPCMTKDGLHGHKKNAGWMAMGFPCTGGEGRIDWKGTNYNRPKMVSFLLETSCAMSPSDKSKIIAEAKQVAAITADSPLIAFNPFVTQYWEVPGYEDADTSFTVDLRSGKGIDDAWLRFIKPKPLKIFLVGRENAWVPGNYMYAVEGDLIWASKNRFTFSVSTARILTGDELSKVRGRCEALKPERDCSRVF
jgi:hypothetical protein